MPKVIGVDEAGRGCVMGPLVLCAYSIDSDKQEALKQMGAKDSKLLSPIKRRELFKKFEKLDDNVISVLSAEGLTDLMAKKVSLNEIEAQIAAAAIRQLAERNDVEKAIVDSPDPVPSKFEKRIRKYYSPSFELVCENKADFNYPVVGAASILAKETREIHIEKLKKMLGIDFGSGYSSDEKTIAFLKTHHNDAILQPHLRHRWETMKRLKIHQFDLTKFF
ncbi:ribonuclease HII [Candidatus Micrarchaeota archaeon]|nr:ribonuclease HII [Candidatus Micrarchaeota archaeon]